MYDKSGKHQGTISNTGALAKSGYRKRKGLTWEVGYDCPYAKPVNWGSGPHTVPVNKLYDWAWYRRKEDWFPTLNEPKKNKDYDRFKTRFKGDTAGHRYEIRVFVFTYYIWKSIIKEGTEPTFFFSDAIHTTTRDAYKIVQKAFENSSEVKVVG